MDNFTLPLFLTMALCFLIAFPLQAQIPASVEDFREAAQVRRTFWEEFNRDSPNRRNSENRISPVRIKDFVEALQKQPQIFDGGTANLILARYRSLFTLQASEFALWFHNAMDISNVIECLSAMGSAYGHLGYTSQKPVYTYSDFFPIRKESNLFFSARIKWVRYPYPQAENPRVLQPLALTFSRLGLHDLAWRVLMEEGWNDHNGLKPYWLDSSYYLFAANNAYRAGKKELAWSFLMNAAVFEHKQFFESVIETAQLWIDIETGEAKLLEAEIATGAERKQLFLEIVERYQNMNAHPRAWLFIQEHKSEFDDPEGLIKAVQDDWLELIRIITQPIFANRIVMYGVQLYPDGADPLSVEIPWAFPEGSLEKLKIRLGEEAEKAKLAETDGFRNWQYRTEENWLSIRAKYISFVDGIVTLEKEDGSEMTVKHSALFELDQNYIRRRLEVEKLTPEEREYFEQLRLKIEKGIGIFAPHQAQ